MYTCIKYSTKYAFNFSWIGTYYIGIHTDLDWYKWGLSIVPIRIIFNGVSSWIYFIPSSYTIQGEICIVNKPNKYVPRYIFSFG